MGSTARFIQLLTRIGGVAAVQQRAVHERPPLALPIQEMQHQAEPVAEPPAAPPLAQPVRLNREDGRAEGAGEAVADDLAVLAAVNKQLPENGAVVYSLWAMIKGAQEDGSSRNSFQVLIGLISALGKSFDSELQSNLILVDAIMEEHGKGSVFAEDANRREVNRVAIEEGVQTTWAINLECLMRNIPLDDFSALAFIAQMKSHAHEGCPLTSAFEGTMSSSLARHAMKVQIRMDEMGGRLEHQQEIVDTNSIGSGLHWLNEKQKKIISSGAALDPSEDNCLLTHNMFKFNTQGQRIRTAMEQVEEQLILLDNPQDKANAVSMFYQACGRLARCYDDFSMGTASLERGDRGVAEFEKTLSLIAECATPRARISSNPSGSSSSASVYREALSREQQPLPGPTLPGARR